jgi:hypothetical protein
MVKHVAIIVTYLRHYTTKALGAVTGTRNEIQTRDHMTASTFFTIVWGGGRLRDRLIH